MSRLCVYRCHCQPNIENSVADWKMKPFSHPALCGKSNVSRRNESLWIGSTKTLSCSHFPGPLSAIYVISLLLIDPTVGLISFFYVVCFLAWLTSIHCAEFCHNVPPHQ